MIEGGWSAAQDNNWNLSLSVPGEINFAHGSPVTISRSKRVARFVQHVRQHHSQGAGRALYRERGELHAQGDAQESATVTAASRLRSLSGYVFFSHNLLVTRVISSKCSPGVTFGDFRDFEG